MKISLLQQIKIGILSSYSFNWSLKILFLIFVCDCQKNLYCKKYKNQYKKQKNNTLPLIA